MPESVAPTPHAGNDAAAVLTARPEQGHGAGAVGGIAPCGWTVLPEARVLAVATARDHDRTPGADRHCAAGLLDIALGPVARKLRAPVSGSKRGVYSALMPITRPASGCSRKISVIRRFEHELHALLAGGEFEAT